MGISYREAREADVGQLARIRARDWGSEQYWRERILGYMKGTLNPQQSLAPRVVLVASQDNRIVGFIAGHLTWRYDCDGRGRVDQRDSGRTSHRSSRRAAPPAGLMVRSTAGKTDLRGRGSGECAGPGLLPEARSSGSQSALAGLARHHTTGGRAGTSSVELAPAP